MTRQDFDSEEEYHFYLWAEEARAHGVSAKWRYHPDPFELTRRATVTKKIVMKTKTKIVDEFLFHPVTYQPDFSIAGLDVDFMALIQGKRPYKFRKWLNLVIVDVKGEYEPQHSKSDIFSIKQKLMWAMHGIYVHKIIPFKFFEKTWVPEEIAYCKNRKAKTRRKKFAKCRLFSELKGWKV